MYVKFLCILSDIFALCLNVLTFVGKILTSPKGKKGNVYF